MRYREYSFLPFHFFTLSPFHFFTFQITTAVPLHVTISIEPPCPIVS